MTMICLVMITLVDYLSVSYPHLEEESENGKCVGVSTCYSCIDISELTTPVYKMYLNYIYAW